MDILTHYFQGDGKIPNHATLPVVIYPQALGEHADEAEKIFNQHKWTNSWVDGVLEDHHYHSNTHEVLGVIKGSCVLVIGGENGQIIEVKKGDVLVLPAGTGHKRRSATDDFTVVGAYPNGISYNLKYGKEDEYDTAVEEIKQVPIPKTDPLFGEKGPLVDLWNNAMA